VKLTTLLHLMLRLRKWGSSPPIHNTPSCLEQKDNFSQLYKAVETWQLALVFTSKPEALEDIVRAGWHSNLCSGYVNSTGVKIGTRLHAHTIRFWFLDPTKEVESAELPQHSVTRITVLRKVNFSYDYQNLLVTLLIWRMKGGSSHWGVSFLTQCVTLQHPTNKTWWICRLQLT